jgi:hypothetical protein
VIAPDGTALARVRHVDFHIASTDHAARIVGDKRSPSRDQSPNKALHLTATANKIIQNQSITRRCGR